jgi:hypothetical protein
MSWAWTDCAELKPLDHVATAPGKESVTASKTPHHLAVQSFLTDA